MSLIGKLYERIVLTSPKIEVLMRKLYWNNVKHLRRFNPFKEVHNTDVDSGATTHIDFQKIEDFIRANGIGEGSIVVVHSSFDVLKSTGLSPDEIINRLLAIVGKSGTIATPVLRLYTEMPSFDVQLKDDCCNIVCRFDKRRTPVKSGMIPFTLSRRKDSVLSPHPLNSLGAIGAHAAAMMEHNMDEDYPKPSGPLSSWKYCLDHGAYVLGLGVDLEHYNSMLHVAEEAFGDWHWSDEEWFRYRSFDVVQDDKSIKRVVVRERKPKWGLLHIAERNLVHDMDKAGIYHRSLIDGVIPVCVENAQEAINFLRSRNRKGYPYFE